MIILDAIKSMTKKSLNRIILFNLSNLTSMALSDRYKEIKKRGRKQMKYLEVTKCVKLNNLQNK
ncbi:MAG: hypothetical protein Q8N71_06735 [candidate division Zixibacteria bacterium]|nr:hypothetical protein [candidate division Zixibacteria bacterium]